MYADRLVSHRSSNKRQWTLLGKTTVTISILALLLSRINLSSCAEAIREALGYWLFFAFLASSLGLIVSTFKWNRLLQALKIFTPIKTLLELYTIGVFVSSFLPGVIGGDVVRCHMAGRRVGGRLKVAATIVAERITGVVALIVMGLLALAWDSARFATPPTLALVGAMLAALVVGLALALSRQLATRLMYRARHLRIRRAVYPLYQLHRMLHRFRRRPLIIALCYSFSFYLAGGLTFLLVCKAFGAPITFIEATSVRVFTYLLTVLPISVGGLGLTQAGDVYLLGLVGIDATYAFAISITRQLFNYGYVLIGGILFIRWRSRSRSVGGDMDANAGEIQSKNIASSAEGTAEPWKRALR
jgi:glycosyltransferase 2 family protein